MDELLSSPVDQIVEISAVIQKIKAELQAAQQVVIGEPRLELSEVTLTISTVTTRNLDGKITVGVPTLGLALALDGQGTRERTQRMVLALEPPEPVITQSATDFDDLDIASALIAMRRELQKGLTEEPRLLPKSLDIEVAFAVERKLTASGGIKLVFVQFGPSAETGQTVTNTVGLKFIAFSLPV